jgi:hypothetical protein
MNPHRKRFHDKFSNISGHAQVLNCADDRFYVMAATPEMVTTKTPDRRM